LGSDRTFGKVSAQEAGRLIKPRILSLRKWKISAAFERRFLYKIAVDSILKGNELSMDILVQYCKDENQSSFNASKRIGFEK